MESAETTAAPVALATLAGPKLYELSQPTLFTAPELRRLTADYETIRRSCAARLSLLFRTEFELKLAALETPTFRQFAGGLAQPTHLTLFKVEPLRGIGVLEISPALALSLLDRLMGGPGTGDTAARELTEIEIALLGQVTHLLTEAWCAHWSGWKPLKSTLIGHENDPRYLQTSSPESSLLVANFAAQAGDSTGSIRLALPFSTLDPLLQKIRAELKPPADPAPPASSPAARTTAWNPALDHVNIPLSAQLSGPQITARELQKLKVGDVLPLPATAATAVQLKLNGVPRFQARLGTRDEHWAVEVLNALNS
jgi:flagellar motor switch protein FliM